MGTKWNRPNIPHKGWTIEDVIDIREDGQIEGETDYQTCMMCNNDRIRYVHIVSHPEVKDNLQVGCVCAEKMTGDYVNPKRLEKKLRQRSARRINWIKKPWKQTGNGNLTLVFEEHRLLIFKDPKTKNYKCKIGEVWGKKTFQSIEQAKHAVFKGIEHLKGKNLWCSCQR
ncbi:hypothetical protein [uncultured Imperialibacter sp.]|uniref:hypothetical protein n=1 Tax=uncultured Imperialibacter sp. TaxID=1672639 RepID=UPI0030D98729|tara:strand:+ start:9618 stop:10127 length:510 start_codon:yes stop_codon:yes gene_type:complete